MTNHKSKAQAQDIIENWGQEAIGENDILGNCKRLEALIEYAIRCAELEGARKMRERAAKEVENVSLKYTDDITGRAGETSKNIRSLSPESVVEG